MEDGKEGWADLLILGEQLTLECVVPGTGSEFHHPQPPNVQSVLITF
jgi:hypothetical protein